MMVSAHVKESRQKIAADKMTGAEKLARALQSGLMKGDLRTLQEAIHMARALAMQIPITAKNYKGLKLSDKYGEDFHVAIAYFTPDLSAIFTHPYEPGKEAEIQEQLSGPGKCCIPIGLIFGIRDHERGARWWSGARPFLNTPLVIMALKQRVEENRNELQ